MFVLYFFVHHTFKVNYSRQFYLFRRMQMLARDTVTNVIKLEIDIINKEQLQQLVLEDAKNVLTS